MLRDLDGVKERSAAGGDHVGQIRMPIATGVGHTDVAVLVLYVGDDEDLGMLGMTPLIEDVDLERAEAPTEVDVLLRAERLVAEQQQ